MQRWSPRGRPWPRGQILKSLALASKVKSLALASRPQVLENWPVLGSRTALFFGKLKFCGAVEKFFGKRFFVEIAWKIFVKTFFFFFWESTCALCPWSLALASSIPVLGLESVCPRKGCPWPWPRIFFVSLALASSLVSSTPPLIVCLGVGAFGCKHRTHFSATDFGHNRFVAVIKSIITMWSFCYKFHASFYALCVGRKIWKLK